MALKVSLQFSQHAFQILLINGSSGIAVGMATNIPTHNLTEVAEACLRVIDNEDITVDELLEVLPGPDFPTAGIINGASGIREAYETGKGKIYLRSRSHVEGEDKLSIVVTELPYQVIKLDLLVKLLSSLKIRRLMELPDLETNQIKME